MNQSTAMSSKKIHKVLNYVERHTKQKGKSPVVREISAATGFGPPLVRKYLAQMESLNVIKLTRVPSGISNGKKLKIEINPKTEWL